MQKLMQKFFLSGVLSLVLGLTSPCVMAQAAPASSGSAAEPPTDLTVPLQSQINRNPAYRERLPQAVLPTEPDPRDSTVRLVQLPAPVLDKPGSLPDCGSAQGAASVAAGTCFDRASMAK
jgi:hypothetical protein